MNKEREFAVCYWYTINGYLKSFTPRPGCRVIEFKAANVKVASQKCRDLWIDYVCSTDQPYIYTLEKMDLMIN